MAVGESGVARRVGVAFAVWNGRFLVICTQVAYAGWGIGMKRIDFTEISGHSMSAASVLPVAGYFIGGRFSRAAAIIAGFLGCCASVLVESHASFWATIRLRRSYWGVRWAPRLL